MKPNGIFKQPTDTVKCSRRHFIKTSALAALGFNLIGCSRSARKPNLLFLWTDEQRADTMAVYGNSKIHAPNLNKLASESVVFEHAYITQPVCTPSRSTVMTGLWPHTNGCTENNISLPANIPCFPEILNDPDYRTGYFGKWHLGDEVFAQHGFEEWISIEDIYWEYLARDVIAMPKAVTPNIYCPWSISPIGIGAILHENLLPDCRWSIASPNFWSKRRVIFCSDIAVSHFCCMSIS